MKTTFSRQFALIAALLLVCMIFTGVSFRFLMLRYLKTDKKETLSADAAAVATVSAGAGPGPFDQSAGSAAYISP